MSDTKSLGINRRAILGAGAVGLAALAMPTSALAARGLIRVGIYEGYVRTVFDKHIFPAFTRATNIAAVSVPEPGSDAWLAQLTEAARRGVTPVDVSLATDTVVDAGIEANLWAPLDLTKIPKAANVQPKFLMAFPDGRTAAVGAMTWTVMRDGANWAAPRFSRNLVHAHPFIDYMCEPSVQAILTRELGSTRTLRA